VRASAVDDINRNRLFFWAVKHPITYYLLNGLVSVKIVRKRFREGIWTDEPALEKTLDHLREILADAGLRRVNDAILRIERVPDPEP
jgi:hypothetical protein